MKVKCKVCNSKNVEDLVYRQDIYKCHNCNLLFRTKEINSKRYIEDDYWYKENEMLKLYQRSIFEWFKDFIVQGDTIEFGGADGDFAILLRKIINQEFKVVFNEIVPMLRPEYKNKNIEEAICTFEDFKTQTHFKNIFFINTLEHLNNPIASMQKVNNMLSNDGKVFILTDNGDALTSHNEIFHHWEHAFLLSEKSTKILCNKTSFKIEKMFKSPQKMLYIILKKEVI